MPIRFEYPAAAGMIGAYASGMAEATQRKRKYLQDLWQQNLEHKYRMEELGARWGGRLGSRLGAGQQAGTWVDPLADDIALPQPGEVLPMDERKKLIQRRAQRKRRARMLAVGKDIPAEWQPIFDPAPTKEDIRFEHQKELEDVKQEHRLAAEQIRRTGIADAASVATIRKKVIDLLKTEIPPDTNAEVRKYLTGKGSILNSLILKGGFDISKPDTLDTLIEAINDYETALKSITKEPIVYFDQTTGKLSDIPVPGGKPLWRATGKPLDLGEEAANKAREKEEKARQAQIKSLTARQAKLQDTIWKVKAANPDVIGPRAQEVINAAQREINKITVKLKDLESPTPAESPAAAGGAAVAPQAATAPSTPVATVAVGLQQLLDILSKVLPQLGGAGETTRQPAPGEISTPTEEVQWDMGNEQPALPIVRNDADYDTLPPNTDFIDPDGRKRHKP